MRAAFSPGLGLATSLLAEIKITNTGVKQKVVKINLSVNILL